MALGCLCRSDNFFVGCVALAEFDIVFYRVFKQVHVLEHKGKVRQKGIVGKVFYVRAAEFDFARVDVPKARNQLA